MEDIPLPCLIPEGNSYGNSVVLIPMSCQLLCLLMHQQPQGLPSPVVHLQTLRACWIMKDDMAISIQKLCSFGLRNDFHLLQAFRGLTVVILLPPSSMNWGVKRWIPMYFWFNTHLWLLGKSPLSDGKRCSIPQSAGERLTPHVCSVHSKSCRLARRLCSLIIS